MSLKTVLLLLSCVTYDTAALSWVDEPPPSRNMVITDTTVPSPWRIDITSGVYHGIEAFLLYPATTAPGARTLDCRVGYIGVSCMPRLPPKSSCETESDAQAALDRWKGVTLQWKQGKVIDEDYRYQYECNSNAGTHRWISNGVVSVRPPPIVCRVGDTTLTVVTVAGTPGRGAATVTVSCSGASDVTLSIPSRNLQLTNGGSTTLSLNNMGETVTLRGVTSAVVDVSAVVSDTSLNAGVYTGSTVLTVSPL